MMLSVAALSNTEQHNQIIEYIENLKKDPNGWKTCIERIISGCSTEEHFMLLKVIELYLKTRYADDDLGQEPIRRWMREWLQNLSAAQAPPYLANKMAHLFGLVFVADYPRRWPNFMQEVFFEHIVISIQITQFFLRTLIAVNSEVVDRDIRRPKEIIERNARIKDAMRDNCNADLAVVWARILAECRDSKCRELCLEVIASYVDWIDVELIANNTITPLIIQSIKSEDTSEAAVSAVGAIIAKGMDVDKKMFLTSSMYGLLENNGFFALPDNRLNDVLKAGPLISSLGTAFIEIHSCAVKVGDTAMVCKCEFFLREQADIALKCLSNEDVGASETVTDFMRRYVSILKIQDVGKRSDFTRRMIHVVMDRYQAPADINLNNPEGENEAQFLEYRKQLRNILSAVGNFEPEAILLKLEPAVQNVCDNWRFCPVPFTEATLSLVYDLPDFIHMNTAAVNTVIADRAKNVVIQVLQSTITYCGSPYINTLYFEIACHYERILLTSATPITMILEAFLDTRGLRQPTTEKRSRIIYLFCRFIRSHKVLLSSRVNGILAQLEPFFLETSEKTFQLTKEDQMYLYESTAILIIHSNLLTGRKHEFVRVLVLSVLRKFLALTDRLPLTQNAQEAQLLYQELANVILYATRITKAFNPSNTMHICDCAAMFIDLMKIFMERTAPDNFEALYALRQYLHRMVVCLDSDIMNFLPVICEKFFSFGPNLKVMHDFLLLLQQVFNRFKKRILETGINIPALFDILWATQRIPVIESEESSVRDMVYYNRAFLQTVLVILSNDLVVLFTSYGEEFMRRFADSIISFVNSSDVASQRSAFQVITKLFTKETNGAAKALIEILWEKAVCNLLQVPLGEYHDPVDALCSVVQHEMYACLQLLRSYATERFDQYLKVVLPAGVVQEFIHCMSDLKGDEFEKEMDNLYVRIRLLDLTGIGNQRSN